MMILFMPTLFRIFSFLPLSAENCSEQRDKSDPTLVAFSVNLVAFSVKMKAKGG